MPRDGRSMLWSISGGQGIELSILHMPVPAVPLSTAGLAGPTEAPARPQVITGVHACSGGVGSGCTQSS